MDRAGADGAAGLVGWMITLSPRWSVPRRLEGIPFAIKDVIDLAGRPGSDRELLACASRLGRV